VEKKAPRVVGDARRFRLFSRHTQISAIIAYLNPCIICGNKSLLILLHRSSEIP
jgi:hypothetical protein